MNRKNLEENTERYLKGNEYPGRVIIIGLNDAGFPVIVYAILGRSENSQNRLFEKVGDETIRTAPIDKTKVKDPELIIYNALTKVELSKEESAFIVTNGRQTDALAQELKTHTFRDILKKWKHEPDVSNYTSRISGVIYLKKNQPPKFSLSIIKPDFSDPGNISIHEFFEELSVTLGMGFCISTYAGNGNPLPPFRGEPFGVAIMGDAKKIAQTYWNMLNPLYRVALVAKVIDPILLTSTIAIINKNSYNS